MSYSFPIPLILLETLKVSFEKEGKALCKDVAKSLGLPPQEVIKRIMKKCQLDVYDIEQPLRCNIMQLDETIYRKCGRPCLLGTERCCLHQRTEQKVVEKSLTLQRLDMPPDSPNKHLWIDSENLVYSSDGKQVGHMKNDEVYLVDYADN